MATPYTIHLSVCQGIVDETRALLDLWQPGQSGLELYEAALATGRLPVSSASRLRNIVDDAFGRRYLAGDAYPATLLKAIHSRLPTRDFTQLLFLFTSRTETILADFVRDVYWPAYARGREALSNVEALPFVARAVQEGRTKTPWPQSTIVRMASNLTGTCGDFGLLDSGPRRVRKIRPYWIEPRVAAFLAYDLHFADLGDNAVVAHPDWALFGLESVDVLEQLKRLSLKGLVTVQSGANLTRLGWSLRDRQELVDVVTRSEF